VKFHRPGPRPGFVELWCAGRLLERVYGRPGTPGQHRSQLFGSAPEAMLAWDEQVTRLERKGYVLGRHDAALMQAICAAPDERAPYLVYADWLCEQGDARGELIMRMTSQSAFDDVLEAHPTQLAPAWWQRAGISVSWRWGFVQRAVVEPAFDAGALRRLLRHPSLAVVRELVLKRPGYVVREQLAQLRAVVPSVLVE
jgi:uncharacterized protein (TIGR02996 family)